MIAVLIKVILFSFLIFASQATRSSFSAISPAGQDDLKIASSSKIIWIRGGSCDDTVPALLHRDVDPKVWEILQTKQIETSDIYKDYFSNLAFASALICYALGLKIGTNFALHSTGRVFRNLVILQYGDQLIANWPPMSGRNIVPRAPSYFEEMVRDVLRDANIQVKTAVFVTSSRRMELRTMMSESKDEVFFYLPRRLFKALTEAELRSLIARECGYLLHGIDSTAIHVNVILGSIFSGAIDGRKMHRDAETQLLKRVSSVRGSDGDSDVFKSLNDDEKVTVNRLALISKVGRRIQRWSIVYILLGKLSHLDSKRQAHYNADAYSAALYGPTSLISALTKMHRLSTTQCDTPYVGYGDDTENLLDDLDDQRPRVVIYEPEDKRRPSRLAILFDECWTPIRSLVAAVFGSRPPLQKRIEALVKLEVDKSTVVDPLKSLVNDVADELYTEVKKWVRNR